MPADALMTAAKSTLPKKPGRKEKVAHIRFSMEELAAVEAAAQRCGLTVSAFIRSLSLEGAGTRPFFTDADKAILGLLAEHMREIGNNLNQLARAINSGRSVTGSDVALSVSDVRAIAGAVSAELKSMARRAGCVRRDEAA
jgi:hypothetical protein